MQTLIFKKTPEKTWFIELPDYSGDPSALQMVLGADELLNELAGPREEISLLITTSLSEVQKETNSTHSKRGWDWLQKAEYIPVASGFYYNHGSKYIWLCDVTQYVLGEFPKIIYFKKIIP